MVFHYFVSWFFVHSKIDMILFPTKEGDDTKSNLNLQVDVEAIRALI